MANYHELSEELQQKIKQDRENGWHNPYAFCEEAVIRRDMSHDKSRLWRPAFVMDIEKIMHLPYYNRYSDKTQVHSFYRNDDISRRAFHVQLVSRIARNIGAVLGLNLDLIEAIALGHDIGHTPFGHEGEYLLNELYNGETGCYFNHNVHSVRVLDVISHRNISLQTLDGILCHNGELEQREYYPKELRDFAAFEPKVNTCYFDQEAIKKLVPSTLEACVVRICDIIAYLGKDRQDALRLKMFADLETFSMEEIGKTNAEIINNLSVNIIKNSYGKGYLKLDDTFFNALKTAKDENFRYIYRAPELKERIDKDLRPMFQQVYYKLLADAKAHNKDSYLYRHHIKTVQNNNEYSRTFSIEEYLATEPNQLVTDYIASMTDDYFMDLYHELFPNGKHHISYIGYFEEAKSSPHQSE